MTEPLISVLMPAWNREKYIRAAINSILRQTHKNLELLIYDDGSTDLTADVVENYCALDPRVRLIRGDKWRSHMHGRNVLMDEAKGDIWCWQDSDDISNMHRLRYETKHFSPEFYVTCPIVYMATKRCPSGTKPWMRVPGKFRSVHAPYKARLHHCFAAGMFAPTDLRCDARLTLGAENTDWLTPLCLDRGISVKALPWALYYVRRHKETVSRWRRLKKNKRRLNREAQIRLRTDRKRAARRRS